LNLPPAALLAPIIIRILIIVNTVYKKQLRHFIQVLTLVLLYAMFVKGGGPQWKWRNERRIETLEGDKTMHNHIEGATKAARTRWVTQEGTVVPHKRRKPPVVA
jgi:hypothetical protein